jgi:hypothetical protein
MVTDIDKIRTSKEFWDTIMRKLKARIRLFDKEFYAIRCIYNLFKSGTNKERCQ